MLNLLLYSKIVINIHITYEVGITSKYISLEMKEGIADKCFGTFIRFSLTATLDQNEALRSSETLYNYGSNKLPQQ